MQLHKNIRILAWFNFFTEFKLYAPIAIIYFANVSGSFALGMAVFSVAKIASALFEIPTGIFSDRIGRKKTVMLGAFAMTGMAVFYALGISFWFLALGAVFEGFGRALYSGNNDALLHDTLRESKQTHQYSEFFGRTSSMLQVALAISGLIGAIIAHWSFPLIMWLSILPQMISVYLSTRLIEPTVNSGESGNIYLHLKEAFQEFLSNRKLRLLSLSSILSQGFGEASYQFQSAFYNTLWPIWAIGIAKTLSTAGAALSFRLSGRILRRFGKLNVLIGANIYTRALNIPALLFPTVASPLIMAATSLSYGVKSTGENTLLQKEFTDRQRATMSSLNAFAQSIFFGVIALSLGFFADLLSPARGLLLFQVLPFTTLLIYWMLARKIQRE